MTFLGLILPLTLLVSTISAGILDNKTVYKILNKADGGVLSLKNSDSIKVYLKTDEDEAFQKWRAKKPLMMRSEWELKPTSDETIDLCADDISNSVKATSGAGEAKYWHIRDAGEGNFEVKSYETSMCLTSQGLNHPVALSACTNSPQQQWHFKEL